MNFGLLASYLLGMTKNKFGFDGKLNIGAFAVGFPIIGSILQLLILPFVYDSPDALGNNSNGTLWHVYSSIWTHNNFEFFKKNKEENFKKVGLRFNFMDKKTQSLLGFVIWFQRNKINNGIRKHHFSNLYVILYSTNQYELAVYWWWSNNSVVSGKISKSFTQIKLTVALRAKGRLNSRASEVKANHLSINAINAIKWTLRNL